MRCLQVAAARLGFEAAKPMTVVATVPPQHMYGFENTVLLTLRSGHAFCAEHPFYPADVSSVLAAAPAPRTLISTPVHLRALLAANVTLPTLHAVVSATAPLDELLARQVEHRFGAPLVEIYGSTESGQIASRHPTRTAIWHLYPGVVLSSDGERVWASGGHIEDPVALGDHIQMVDEQHFELGARLQDVVNIAGKRNSIAYLNHQLLSIPGVEDGAFFLPHEARDSPTKVARLCAVVVAPGSIRRYCCGACASASTPCSCRVRFDWSRSCRATVPANCRRRRCARCWWSAKVRAQPGATAEATIAFSIPVDHPALPGHFPGAPVVPGALLLAEGLPRLESALGAAIAWRCIECAKFLRPVAAGPCRDCRT